MGNALTTMRSAYNTLVTKQTSFQTSIGRGYSSNPDRPYTSGGTERSFVSALYNRIALDVAAINIVHCTVSDDGQYMGPRKNSFLNNCLTISANIDQTPRSFFQDLVMTMFDEGVAAIVPIDVTDNPEAVGDGAFDVVTMRVGRVKAWYPRHIDVEVYNDRTGERVRIIVPKKQVAVIENPLYSVMNEPNSVLKRLIRALNMLDAIDEQSAAGKMDLIIQLPYSTKTEYRQKEAARRRDMIEEQLAGSKYGIAYADVNEKVTQLNRPVENNLMERVKYLTTQVYGQLGLSEDVANGGGSEEEQINYFNKTVEPIISAICDSMRRTFLTSTALTQHQDIRYFRDPFRLVPVDKLAEIADKFTRNEIMTSNEFRSVIGRAKVDDPAADELRNKNLNKADSGSDTSGSGIVDGNVQNGNPNANNDLTQSDYDQDLMVLDSIDDGIDELEGMVDDK